MILNIYVGTPFDARTISLKSIETFEKKVQFTFYILFIWKYIFYLNYLKVYLNFNEKSVISEYHYAIEIK